MCVFCVCLCVCIFPSPRLVFAERRTLLSLYTRQDLCYSTLGVSATDKPSDERLAQLEKSAALGKTNTINNNNRRQFSSSPAGAGCQGPALDAPSPHTPSTSTTGRHQNGVSSGGSGGGSGRRSIPLSSANRAGLAGAAPGTHVAALARSIRAASQRKRYGGKTVAPVSTIHPHVHLHAHAQGGWVSARKLESCSYVLPREARAVMLLFFFVLALVIPLYLYFVVAGGAAGVLRYRGLSSISPCDGRNKSIDPYQTPIDRWLAAFFFAKLLFCGYAGASRQQHVAFAALSVI